mmetsp:Transcript_11582/g.25776  ORF Transcript_11582/g.25776 Transcript_11582/m.25776 type:complete len:220 (-) Transcript_11582:465-1124(-)
MALNLRSFRCTTMLNSSMPSAQSPSSSSPPSPPASALIPRCPSGVSLICARSRGVAAWSTEPTLTTEVLQPWFTKVLREIRLQTMYCPLMSTSSYAYLFSRSKSSPYSLDPVLSTKVSRASYSSKDRRRLVAASYRPRSVHWGMSVAATRSHLLGCPWSVCMEEGTSPTILSIPSSGMPSSCVGIWSRSHTGGLSAWLQKASCHSLGATPKLCSTAPST